MRHLTILLITSSVLWGCKKGATVWEGNWSIPLVNDTLTLSNLVNDSTISEAGGIYHVSLKRSLFDLDILKLIDIRDTTITEEFYIPGFITIPPGYAFVSEFDDFEMNVENVELRNIELKSGEMVFYFSNPIATKVFFDVRLPGVFKDGVAFHRTYEIEAGTNTDPGEMTKVLDLSGYMLDLTGANGYGRNMLSAEFYVSSDPNGPEVSVLNSSLIQTSVTFRNIQLGYALGYFGNQVISDTMTIDFGAADLIESGAVDLPAATIQFEIENGLKVGAEALLTRLAGENQQGTILDLIHPQMGIPFMIDPATGAWSSLTPSTRIIEFNPSNSNAEAFLENLAKKYELGYAISLNPWGNISAGSDELFPNSRLRVNVRADMPMTIGMDQLKIKDKFQFKMTNDVSKTHIKAGELLLNVSNTFPLSANIKLHLADVNSTILHSVTGSETIKSAKFGALNAANMMEADSEVSFVLSKAAIADINRVKYIFIEAEFNSPDAISLSNEPQEIPVGAYFVVKLRSRFTTENRF